MEYELNELNEPIIKYYNKQLTFDMHLSDDKETYDYFRINADGKVIILSQTEIEGIIDYYNTLHGKVSNKLK